jgi:hypothetical protein|tara:strand:- start:3830 stop:4306 length:477 start_codon:yes stop_codon:yes gene_type:complete
MELPLSELLILVASILGVFAAALYMRARLGNSEINTKLKNRYLDYIGQLEEEVKQHKKVARTAKARAEKESIGIKDYDESNPMGAIQELIMGLEPLLPSAVRPFLRSPQLLAQAEKVIKDNPDVIKDVLSKFVKGTTKKNDSGTESKKDSYDFDSMSV